MNNTKCEVCKVEIPDSNVKVNSKDLVYVDVNEIHSCSLEDCESLSLFINNCYFGDESDQGWTNERHLIDKPRTNTEMLKAIINDKTTVLFMFFNSIDQTLVGTVELKHKPEMKCAYLGILTVRPDLQNQGYGKVILSVAEDYVVKNWNVECIEITVIIQRPELIEYYSRRGYVDTGRREPFPIHDGKLDKLKRTDLEFGMMRKYLKKT